MVINIPLTPELVSDKIIESQGSVSIPQVSKDSSILGRMSVAPEGISFGSVATGVMGLASRFGLLGEKLQRSYNWELLLPGIGGLGISKYCQEVSFGEYNMDDLVKMRYGSEQRGYAGFFNAPVLTARFIKPVPDIVFDYFMAWKLLIKDATGLFFPKVNYAMDAYIVLYDTTGIPSGMFKLSGVFPTKFPKHELSMSTETVMMYDVEFNIDRITTQ